MKKHIFIPYSNLNIGGVPTKIIDIVNMLEKTHPDTAVHILLQKGHYADQRLLIQNPNASVIDFSFPFPVGRKLFYILWLWCHIFCLRPVAVLTFLSPYALPTLLIKNILFWIPFRVIVSEDHYTRTMIKRMVAPRLQTIAIRFLYPRADAVICPTKAIQRQLTLLCKLPKNKASVVFNWTKLADTSMSKTKRVWDIIHIGRLVNSKHPLRVAEIMSHYVTTHPNTKCAIVGEGEETPHIIEFIHNHHLEKHIHVYPATSNTSLYLRQAKTFLFLPEKQTEGFPIVLLEAMACGVIIVTERFRGGDEILTDNLNACVAPLSGVTPSLIQKAITNPYDIQNYARSYVEKNCSSQNIHQYICALDNTYVW